MKSHRCERSSYLLELSAVAMNRCPVQIPPMLQRPNRPHRTQTRQTFDVGMDL